MNGKDNAEEQLSSQEVAAVATGVSALVLILIIIGAIIAALCVVAILAATTGIFIKHRVMAKIDSHVFEGELVEMKAVPQGVEIVNPNFDDFKQCPTFTGTALVNVEAGTVADRANTMLIKNPQTFSARGIDGI